MLEYSQNNKNFITVQILMNCTVSVHILNSGNLSSQRLPYQSLYLGEK
uniref:Uncharacterized protein n=1 Tax=Anguilla anguilla TaxID=7936 RepID=A0A0E9S883_ANGAN